MARNLVARRAVVVKNDELERMTPGETEDHRRWGGFTVICEKCQEPIVGIVNFHRCGLKKIPRRRG